VTQEAPQTDPHGTLYVDDDELIRRLGVPKKEAKAALQMLDDDRRTGFPPKQKLWGDRRYWPAVKAYFDREYGLKIPAPQPRERQYG
jgi:hypothetical protein